MALLSDKKRPASDWGRELAYHAITMRGGGGGVWKVVCKNVRNSVGIDIHVKRFVRGKEEKEKSQNKKRI